MACFYGMASKFLPFQSGSFSIFMHKLLFRLHTIFASVKATSRPLDILGYAEVGKKNFRLGSKYEFLKKFFFIFLIENEKI